MGKSNFKKKSWRTFIAIFLISSILIPSAQSISYLDNTPPEVHGGDYSRTIRPGQKDVYFIASGRDIDGDIFSFHFYYGVEGITYWHNSTEFEGSDWLDYRWNVEKEDIDRLGMGKNTIWVFTKDSFSAESEHYAFPTTKGKYKSQNLNENSAPEIKKGDWTKTIRPGQINVYFNASGRDIDGDRISFHFYYENEGIRYWHNSTEFEGSDWLDYRWNVEKEDIDRLGMGKNTVYAFTKDNNSATSNTIEYASTRGRSKDFGISNIINKTLGNLFSLLYHLVKYFDFNLLMSNIFNQ